MTMSEQDTTELVEDENTEDCADCAETIVGDDVDSMTEVGHGMVCESCRDSYSTCEGCDDVVSDDDINAVDGGSTYVCNDCRDNSYFYCEDCEEYAHNDYSAWVTGGDRMVCESCRDNSYSYCDRCDGYYYHDDGPCCAEDACDCESPARRFSIKNGGALLDNDVETTVNLPAGFITDEGIGAISRLIRESAPPVDHNAYGDGTTTYTDQMLEASKWRDLAYTLADAVGTEWQRSDGNFTKRLSRHAYKQHGIKIPPAIVSQVGNLGSQHSQGSDFTVAVTRELNQSAADFGHEDSCWWQSYYESRCTLKSNGGFGLRSFDDVEYDKYDYQIGPWSGHFGSAYTPVGKKTVRQVTGRAWVFPLKMVNGSLIETFDVESADAYVVFNGYGTMGGYAAARILSQMTGTTYRKVSLDVDNDGYEHNAIYINSDAGYLVGPESIVADYTDGTLSMSLDVHSNLHHNESRVTANV